MHGERCEKRPSAWTRVHVALVDHRPSSGGGGNTAVERHKCCTLSSHLASSWWSLLPAPTQPTKFEIKVLVNESAGAAAPLLRGAGIEDVNHELYGGIYAQMVFGESFEEPAGADGVSGSRENNKAAGSPGLQLTARHTCTMSAATCTAL